MNSVLIANLQRYKTSVIPWESVRMLPKGGSDAQKGISPTLSSHAGKAGDTGDVVHDLMDQVASLEESLPQMGTSSKMPFCFV